MLILILTAAGGAAGAAVLHRLMAKSTSPLIQKTRAVIFGGGGPGEPVDK